MKHTTDVSVFVMYTHIQTHNSLTLISEVVRYLTHYRANYLFGRVTHAHTHIY